MSNWITINDYKHKIRDEQLNQIIDEDESVLDGAEKKAIAAVFDAIHEYYDVDTIEATSGTDRPDSVIGWCQDLVMYYLYERVPDDYVPERVVKNYDDTIAILDDIASGKRSVRLTRKTEEDGTKSSKFRWGSNQPARTHI